MSRELCVEKEKRPPGSSPESVGARVKNRFGRQNIYTTIPGKVYSAFHPRSSFLLVDKVKSNEKTRSFRAFIAHGRSVRYRTHKQFRSLARWEFYGSIHHPRSVSCGRTKTCRFGSGSAKGRNEQIVKFRPRGGIKPLWTLNLRHHRSRIVGSLPSRTGYLEQ